MAYLSSSGRNYAFNSNTPQAVPALTALLGVITVSTYPTVQLIMQKQVRSIDLKIVAIGNSRGVRLPKTVLDKYSITHTLVLEEREDGLFFRNKTRDKRLSWTDTYKEMSRESEDWSDFDATIADGLRDDSGQW